MVVKDKDDFYIDEKGLASYFEAAWLSKFRELGFIQPLASKSKPVPETYIDSPYFRDVAQWISANATVAPQSLLEIGPALGRVCYETIQCNPSLTDITVVEPSQRLRDGFRRLLMEGQSTRFPYIKSLKELNEMEVDTQTIANSCRHVTFTVLDTPLVADTLSRQFDWVFCLNVIDNATNPLEIVRATQQATRQGGVLALASSYQWSKQYLNDFSGTADDINTYFDSGWRKLAETDFDYKFRYNERYTQLFSSHAVIYQKVTE